MLLSLASPFLPPINQTPTIKLSQVMGFSPLVWVCKQWVGVFIIIRSGTKEPKVILNT
jgi:hypothetical protein